MINKKDMIVDLKNETIDIPEVGILDIKIIFDAYERIQQKKGIEAAKLKGTAYKGRKPLDIPEHFEEYVAQVDAGNITVVEAIRYLNISRASYYRLKDRIKEGVL